MIINMFFTDDPVCPCCNEHMGKSEWFDEEDIGIKLSDDDFYCQDCGYVALNGVDIKHKSKIENE